MEQDGQPLDGFAAYESMDCPRRRFLSAAKLARYIEGRSSRNLQAEFPDLRYWILPAFSR
jgi:hypothetical protein